MESKLTLPTLCAYAAVGVNAKLSEKGIFNLDEEYPEPMNRKSGPIRDFGFTNGQMYGAIQVSEKYSIDFCETDEIVLHLRPLSDLTKPIKELDGKTPMQAVKSALWKERYGWPRIWLNSEYTEGKDGVVLIPTDSGVSIRCVPDYYMIPLSAFEIVRNVLLSLHFDLYGGIEAGWALPLTAKQD